MRTTNSITAIAVPRKTARTMFTVIDSTATSTEQVEREHRRCPSVLVLMC